MDHAVSLVQAYLQLNGYFTSAEYPIVAGTSRTGFRAITDIDILAFRFPMGGPISARGGRTPKGLDVSSQDPGLGIPNDCIDMIVGEVKEGRVGINSGIRDPQVLQSVLRRFGDVTDPGAVVERLLATGIAEIPPSYSVRLIAFGSFPPGSEVPPCRIVSLGHVLEFLQAYVHRNWSMLRHLQFKDPAIGFLMTLEKAKRGEAGRRGESGVEVVLPPGEEQLHGRRKGEIPPQKSEPPVLKKRK